MGSRRSLVFLVIAALGTGLGLTALAAADDDQVATITRFYGKAEILENPQSSVGGTEPHAMYEGKYYTVKKAQTGSKLRQGSIIQTGPKTKVRLVYSNGDQISVDALSAYRVDLMQSGKSSKPVIDLLFGKFRAIINKNGPRSGLTVRSRTMLMGVRGTDFYVAARDVNGASRISVLRGKVEATATTFKDARPIVIASGYTADIPAVEPPPAAAGGKVPAAAVTPGAVPPPAPAIVVTKTNQEELAAIQRASTIKKAEVESGPASKLEPEVQATLAKLEQQAIASTLQDIQADDPALYEKIAKDKIQDVDLLQTITVKKVMRTAPAAPLKDPAAKGYVKPSGDELPELKDSVYDKYFKE
jgi:hypothetical protein